MNEIKIDFDACNGCKICYKACFVDVIRWDEQAKRPVIAYPEDCASCNVCELNCPKDAIEVIVDYDKPYPPVVEPGFPYQV